MKLLSKKGKQDNLYQPNGIAKGVQHIYKYTKGRWAIWMSRRTERLSRRTWIVLLIVFVVLIGTYSIYLTVSSLIRNEHHSFSITPIRKPRHITETGESKVPPKVPDGAYDRIKHFRLYMDSLARSPGGRMQYDSITSRRPGLMDSVRFIENYYQQLKKQ